MQVHETWREEIGFIFTVVGFTLTGYAIVDFAADLPPYNSNVIAWVLIIIGLIALIGGIGLHFTRPSRVAAKEAKTEQGPATAPPASSAETSGQAPTHSS